MNGKFGLIISMTLLMAVSNAEAALGVTHRHSPDQDGDGSLSIQGEQRVWHTIALTLDGPFAEESDGDPNPFLDFRLTAKFQHADGTTQTIPGYFAADGNAGQTGATKGSKWRVLFVPNRGGEWNYQVTLHSGKLIAVEDRAKSRLVWRKTGVIRVTKSDKSGRDLRGHGRLRYVGKRYLQFAGTSKYFLKVGADAPETLLAFADFDGTIARKKNVPLKKFLPHVPDWKEGDPTWKDGKGKGLIGAINYLSGKGCNAFSFLTYNAGGDGDNVWPYAKRDDKLHLDCSKLDQWGIVFDHATQKGMFLHFKLQETENDDDRQGKRKSVPESLDGGDLGIERKLYLRELVARFGHNLALNWNLGEENTQTTAQQIAMINYIHQWAGQHGQPIVVHTYPNQQDKVYRPLLGDRSNLSGVSLQNSHIKDTHRQTLKWIRISTASGKPWIVAFDESGSAAHGQAPDLGYISPSQSASESADAEGFTGRDRSGKFIYTQHEVRRQTLWGHLMAGGAGVEYYFGYQFPENDLRCEDWRSRDQSWDYCRIAIQFFHRNEIPFHEMQNANAIVGNAADGNQKYCLAKPGEVYVVYLAKGGQTNVDLTKHPGDYRLTWLNPRTGKQHDGGNLTVGKETSEVGPPPEEKGDDWGLVIRAAK